MLDPIINPNSDSDTRQKPTATQICHESEPHPTHPGAHHVDIPRGLYSQPRSTTFRHLYLYPNPNPTPPLSGTRIC